MKKVIVLFIAITYGFSIFAQIWERKNVGNNVSVSMPSGVNYELKNTKGKNVGQYICKSDNCIFMVFVMYEMRPDYAEFINLDKAEQKNITSLLLDNNCNGKLMYVNGKSLSESAEINNYQARNLTYKAVNPVTGNESERHSFSFVVANKLFSFECWYLIENSQSQTEKNKFIKSIEIK